LLELDVLCGEVPIFGEAYAKVDKTYLSAREKLKFNEALKHVLDQLVTDLIETTNQRVRDSGIATVEDVRRLPRRIAGFSETFRKRNGELKKFLFANIYDRPVITEDRDRSVHCLEELFGYYLDSPGSMPASHEELTHIDLRHVVVCDYIAGMTDQFLLRQYHQHFGSGADVANASA
jgi:dGTPase